METVKNPYERISVWFGFLAIVCYMIILLGVLWMAVSSFLRGDIFFGVLMIVGEGILLFLAAVIVHMVGKEVEVEKYVGM